MESFKCAKVEQIRTLLRWASRALDLKVCASRQLLIDQIQSPVTIRQIDLVRRQRLDAVTSER
jgi:hypothetical protein